MLSLKRFLDASGEEVALRKVVSLLMEKIGTEAVEGDPADLDAFRKKIEGIRECMAGDAKAEPLYVAAGSAVEAMEGYNRRITAFLRKQDSELRSIVSMITEAMVKIGGESVQSAQHLQEIGDQFEQAGGVDDLKTLKSRLKDC